ncbi:lasso peptide biosynthesis protein [Kineococcus sp. LSe6-4]|uniref:Lasso peptide biosynthesis protein n=1 Tax=Kineococcus halophytocola TaxID=3234027 RepID=A0ABV4H262_9ACTN
MRSLAAVRADLEREGMSARCTAPVPALPGWSRVLVEGTLREHDATCLQRCLVLQAWFAAHGQVAEVVVAVPHATRAQFSAHAWIRGYDRDEHDRYRELTVLRP